MYNVMYNGRNILHKINDQPDRNGISGNSNILDSQLSNVYQTNTDTWKYQREEDTAHATNKIANSTNYSTNTPPLVRKLVSVILT